MRVIGAGGTIQQHRMDHVQMATGILAMVIALTVFPAIAAAGCYSPDPSGEELLEAIIFVEDVDGQPLPGSFVDCRPHSSEWTVFAYRTDSEGRSCLHIQEMNPSPAEKGVSQLRASCRVTDAWGGLYYRTKRVDVTLRPSSSSRTYTVFLRDK